VVYGQEWRLEAEVDLPHIIKIDSPLPSGEGQGEGI